MFYARHYHWALRYPFAFILTPFALGILTHTYLPSHYRLTALFFLLTTILWLLLHHLLPLWSFSKNSLLVKDLLLILTCFWAGHAYTHFSSPLVQKSHFHHHLNHITAYKATMTAPWQQSKNYYTTTLTLQAICIDKKWQKATGKVKLKGFGKPTPPPYGAQLTLQGHPHSTTPPLTPQAFNEKKYLAIQGIHHIHHLKNKKFPQWQPPKESTFSHKLHNLRQWNLQKLTQYLTDKDDQAILSTMTLGIKGKISPTLKEAYNQAGISHILAISGLHISLLYAFLFFLFFYLLALLFGRRRIYHLFILILLWGYALLTGFSPSILRATSMLSLISLGQWLRKYIIKVNLLAAIAFFLLLYNPLLLYDIGFQLSFTAVSGILSFYPLLQNLLPITSKIGKRWWQMTTLSLAAQMGTLPLSLYYFHYFPTYFLLGNWLLLPLVPLLLSSALMLILFSPIPWIAQLLALAPQYILTFIHTLLRYIENLPYATLGPIYYPFIGVILAYLILAQGALYLLKQQKKYLLLLTLTLFASLSLGIYNHHRTVHQKKIIFYSTHPSQIIAFIHGQKAIILAIGKITSPSYLYQKTILPHLQSLHIKTIEWIRWENIAQHPLLHYRPRSHTDTITWENKTITFLKKKPPKFTNLPPTDYLIFHAKALPIIEKYFKKKNHPHLILINNSLIPPTLPVYILTQKGAYIVPLT